MLGCMQWSAASAALGFPLGSHTEPLPRFCVEELLIRPAKLPALAEFCLNRDFRTFFHSSFCCKLLLFRRVLAMGSQMSRFSYQPLAADEIRVVEFDEEQRASPTIHVRLRHIKRPGGESTQPRGRVKVARMHPF